MLINQVQEFHQDVFFSLHSLLGKYPEISSWVFVIAEKIDWWVVVAAIIFVVSHVHKKTELFSSQHILVSLREGFVITIAVLIAWGVSYILKYTISFPRPFLALPFFEPLFDYGGYDSFPSGHATLFMSLAAVITFRHRLVGYVFVFLAIAISLARVIAGVHFPVDIFAGWVIGIVIPFLVYRLFHKE